MICLIISILSGVAEGGVTLYEGEDCIKCVLGTLDPTVTYKGVCRSQFGFSTSYCCTEDESDWTKGSSFTCQNMPFCSWEVPVNEMKYLACPHVTRPCGGIKNPNIKLNLGDSRNVNINVRSTFSTVDSCYYTLSTYDKIDAANLDPYNRKYMQVYVNSIASLDVYVANGTSEAAIQEAQPVTASRYNFTYPNTGNFYVVVRAQQGSSNGDHKLDITFRYYEYDPKCHYYQDWNGTDCKNNYTRYCSDLTEEWRQKLNNSEAVVVYNGTACVIVQNLTETVINKVENVTVKYEVINEKPSDEYLATLAETKQYYE